MYKTSDTDAANITQLITRMTDYFIHNPADKKALAAEYAAVVKVFWGLIASIYSLKWDLLSIEDKNICKLVDEKILPGYKRFGLVNEKVVEKSSSSLPSVSLPSNMVAPSPPPTATSAAIPPLLTSGAPLKVLKPSNMKKSYVQASKMNISSNVEDVLQVKEAFPSLLANKLKRY